MSESAADIAAKAEGMVRLAASEGHLVALRRWHDHSWCAEVFECDLAVWDPQIESYGKIAKARAMVTDQIVFAARDPHFVLADAAYQVVRATFLKQGVWADLEARWRRECPDGVAKMGT